jgi:UDP-N-acetylmuramate dehydrogenase
VLVKKNISLKPYNTFGIDTTAKYFVEVNTISELTEVLNKYKNQPLFILGGGSNMLLTQDIDALVVYINLKGKTIVSSNRTHATIKAMAGENWHELVLWTIANNLGGIENLSLIPGNTGTAPIQNIGAYGVELKDVFVSCSATEIATGKELTFTLEDCNFGYRNSIFKNELKGKYIITSVQLKLTKENHKLNTSYGAIEEQLDQVGITEPTIKDVSNAVIAIRQSKLPDPKEIGNSGSFFKNPVVSKEIFSQFIAKHPNAPFYKVSETEYKIPAGWLIEQSGFKGKRFGDAGVHKKQALVLVNYGGASGKEIKQLSLKIQNTVEEKFGISLEAEVNIL